MYWILNINSVFELLRFIHIPQCSKSCPRKPSFRRASSYEAVVFSRLTFIMALHVCFVPDVPNDLRDAGNV